MTVLDSPDLSADSESEALAWLHQNKRTDGLPVVIPTAERVEDMLEGTVRAATDVLGSMGPSSGKATVGGVAVNAVMAGCLPQHFPVLIAAVRAVCDPRIDLGQVQSTTHILSPTIIVNGPARKAAGIACGFGALGPGHRANLSIGRALRLCMINIGGGWPNESDMAILGHAGKIAQCLGEDEESSPIEPLHVSLGYRADQSTVTVICTEGPHSVLGLVQGNDPTMPDRLIDVLAMSLSGVGSNNTQWCKGHVLVVLNPDHVNAIVAGGHTRETIIAALADRSGARVEDLRRVAPPSAVALYDGLDPSDRFRSLSIDRIVLIVAGGTGMYSAVMPSWGQGDHGNLAVTVEVDP